VFVLVKWKKLFLQVGQKIKQVKKDIATVVTKKSRTMFMVKQTEKLSNKTLIIDPVPVTMGTFMEIRRKQWWQ
jgi:hypothetical protein